MTEPHFEHRTRSSYDTLAEDYAEWIHDELAHRTELGGHPVSLDFYRRQPAGPAVVGG